MYCSDDRHRGRINEPGVGRYGEREREEYRARAPMALLHVPVAPFSERNPPGEGRIVTGGVHHAQHRLLDVEVMMLVINWRCAL